MTEIICFSGESWIKRFYLKNIQNNLNKDPYTFQQDIFVYNSQHTLLKIKADDLSINRDE